MQDSGFRAEGLEGFGCLLIQRWIRVVLQIGVICKGAVLFTAGPGMSRSASSMNRRSSIFAQACRSLI